MNTEATETKFDPSIHSVSPYRLWRKPAEGEILSVQKLNEMEIALFKDTCGGLQWRILEPESPIPVDRIEITRAEGPSHLCDKTKIIRKETKKGDGKPGSFFEKDWECSAFICADSEFVMWGMTAPKSGGYDKCDFKVFWEDGSCYQGRFDLQHGGKADGENFRDSLRSRLLYYSGLASTPYGFKRKNAIEDYSDSEARAQYLKCVGSYKFVDGARKTLATCEL